MNVTEAIRARRSIRKFTGAEIPQEHLDAILEAAMLGPSARNMRPYEFAVVKDRALLKELSEACPRWYMAEGAACVIIVFARPDLEEGLGHEFWQQDCSAATENILLQALELGYGTCWCGVYPIAERVVAIRRILGTGENSVPVSLIPMGVPAEHPAPRGHYDKSRVKYY